jgi:hypothetical protein
MVADRKVRMVAGRSGVVVIRRVRFSVSDIFALSSGRLRRGPLRGPLLKAISPRRPASASLFDEKGKDARNKKNKKHEHDRK